MSCLSFSKKQSKLIHSAKNIPTMVNGTKWANNIKNVKKIVETNQESFASHSAYLSWLCHRLANGLMSTRFYFNGNLIKINLPSSHWPIGDKVK